MAISDQNLIWVDMEMTGLIPDEHRVIEIATIVTDCSLKGTGGGPGDRREPAAGRAAGDG